MEINIGNIVLEDEFNFGNIELDIVKAYPELENIEINPSKEEQTFKSENYYGYNEVKVNGVTNEVDKNIVPENIKEGVEILGVAGNVEELNPTEIEIMPMSVVQEVTPQEPYNAFSKVTVGAQSGVNPDEYFENEITSSNRQYFFDGFYFLKKIHNEFYVNTDNISYSFYGYTFEEAPNLIGEGRVTNWYYFLMSAKKVREIPQYDTSNGTNLSYAFYADSIESIALLDFSKATNIIFVVDYNSDKLTNLGGFKDLGKNYLTSRAENYANYTLNLSGNTNLTLQSALNVLNNLYDIASLGCQRQLVRFHTNIITLLQNSEEGQQALAEADAKGWNITT